MKISLITATYNTQKTILRCLESVSGQTYKNIEHIIIDGKSSDDTLQIIRNFGKHKIKLISEPDTGIYDALNKGIKNCTGDVIGFLHADDYFTNVEVISDVMTLLNSTGVDGVYGDLQYVNSKDQIKRFWHAGEYHSGRIKNGWMPPHPTLFLKKTVYETIGSFKISFKISADYDFILRLFQHSDTKIQYLPKVLVKMQTGGVSNRSILNLIQKSKEDYLALKANHLSFPLFILLKKNFSKLPQLFKK